jgi:hypothetical protein
MKAFKLFFIHNGLAQSLILQLKVASAFICPLINRFPI